SPDDPGVLRFGADHEAGYVLDEQDRGPLAVGVLDEVGHLFGALRINDAANLGRLTLLPLDDAAGVGDDSHRAPFDGAVAADHLGRHVGLELVELPGVEHALEHGAHIVAHAVVRRQQLVPRLRTALGLSVPGG